jgi:hypothetical protein
LTPPFVLSLSTNRRYYGDEIANPRIEYGFAMTKWAPVSGVSKEPNPAWQLSC